MLVTLSDGIGPSVYNTETENITSVRLLKHCLRFHIYDPETRLAVVKYSTSDPEAQKKILSAAIRINGLINSGNTWIRSKYTAKELWPLKNEPDMVLKDLRGYWGDRVSLRGTSKRYIYYLSDGSMSNTPDAIGAMGRMPLIYEGFAMATIFDIDSLDPLSPDKNIVHWLTKPMWESFHTGKRRVPKEFPWPTGFLATKWCQRDGYSRYSGGISLASMTQGQTVGTWSITSLPQFWAERKGNDILGWLDKRATAKPNKNDEVMIAKQIKHFVHAKEHYPHGPAGMLCPKCGSYFSTGKRTCKKCQAQFTLTTTLKYGDMYCTACGNISSLCECGDAGTIVKLSLIDMDTQIKLHSEFLYSW